MRLLLMNTCGAEGTVALADADGVLAVETLPGRGTSEHVMPAVRRLFAAQAWSVAQLTCVAVVHGPGSFTGVRVGLSAAKGLCEAADVGLVAISRLELVAAQASGDEVVALLDAGRGEFFCGLYRKGARVREALLPLKEVERILGDGQMEAITCEPRVLDNLVAAGWQSAVKLVREPGAEEMLRMALQRVGAAQWDDVALIDANYLRRTDAELLAATR